MVSPLPAGFRGINFGGSGPGISLDVTAANQRIAEELVVGITTVKSHVNGIFRKLGAQSRIEAIARARELRPARRVIRNDTRGTIY